MSQREIEIRCACFIANLEGRKHLVTKGYNDPPFLEDLDRRLRFIELRNESATSPPTHAPTWESLAWRICRLDSPGKHLAPKVLTTSQFGSLLPEDTDVGFDTLVRIVGDLVVKLNASGLPLISPNSPCNMPKLPKLVDDEEKLDIIRQRLFFIAGKRQQRITDVPMTKREVYVLAADLSLDSESNSNGPLGVPPPPWLRRGPGGAGKKGCCGCCGCNCHRVPPPGMDVVWATKEKSKFKKFFKFGWLKSLACWRKKKSYASSVSTSTSSSC